MILSFFFSFIFASPLCEKVNLVHPDYPNIEARIDKEIAKASNLVTVASEADQVLSKLISAKSPILFSWLKKRELMSAPEEKIAHEWRKYYLENFILGQFPTAKPKINVSVENLFQQINKIGFDPKFKAKVDELLQIAKKDTQALVLSWKVPEKTKTEINNKIASIKLYWFEKIKGSRFQNKPLEFLKWGFAYDPVHNQINIGTHARQYPNDSNIYAVLAHEIAHSFDPCRWSSFFKEKNPFASLYACLRSQESGGAKKRDDSRMQEMISKKYLSTDMANSLKKHPTCNRSFYPPIGTQKDQLPETFADWVATEVVAKNKKFNVSQSRLDLCAKNDLSAGSSYLSNQDRLKKIYLAHPKHEQKNSPPKTKYCSFSSESVLSD